MSSFTPIKLTPKTKHQVSISNDTFDRIERIARHFGGRGYTVGSLVEHIIIDHLRHTPTSTTAGIHNSVSRFNRHSDYSQNGVAIREA